MESEQNGYIYTEMRKGMYGIPKYIIITNCYQKNLSTTWVPPI